jgi:hypothetical protein
VAATHTGKEDAPPTAPTAAKPTPAAPHRLPALQRSISNQAVGRLLGRQVRIDKGARRVDEAYYTTGAGKSIGSRHSVAGLISDGVKAKIPHNYVPAALLEQRDEIDKHWK